VVSGSWLKGHSVYRNFAQAVRALSQDPQIELSLVFLGDKTSNQRIVTESFMPKDAGAPRIKYVGWQSHLQLVTDANWIFAQQFDILFYPDLGMTPQSLILGNKRLAKGLQIATYGHSASTQGAVIDYWIGGAGVEVAGNAHYSEVLVLLPGLGITHEPPSHPPLTKRDAAVLPHPFIIVLSWSLVKLNFPHLQVLKKILQSAKFYFVQQQKVSPRFVLRFMLINVESARESLASELLRQFEPLAEVEVFTSRIGDAYMRTFQEGHLFLGSHPYGDCNTVLDALVLGVPPVLWEGNHWRNRIGPAMLRRAGLDYLVADNEEDYVLTAASLMVNRTQWSLVAHHVQTLDLNNLFFQSKELNTYPAIFRELYHNHSEVTPSDV